MNISTIVDILTKHYNSPVTRSQYEKTVQNGLTLLKSDNVYDIYNNIDTIYDMSKKNKASYLSKYFSNLKSVLEKMSDDQKRNIKKESITQLLQYATKKFHEDVVEERSEHESDKDITDDSDSDYCTNDNVQKTEENQMLILDFKVNDVEKKLNDMKKCFAQYHQQTSDDITMLQDLILQLLASPDINHASRNIASSALTKIFDSKKDQRSELSSNINFIGS